MENGKNVSFLPVLAGLESIFCWWRKDKLLELFLCCWITLTKSVSLLLSLFAIFSLTFHTLSCFTRTSCVRNDVAQELNKKENHFTNSRMCSSICSAHLRFEGTEYGPNLYFRIGHKYKLITSAIIGYVMLVLQQIVSWYEIQYNHKS